MSQPVLFHELTREEARARAGEALLVLPLGATEQHGPHLPVLTDTITVEHVAAAAVAEAAAAVPVLLAPTLPFGSSDHHLPFGGTLSLRTETYYRVLCDLIASLAAGGVTRIFLVNGHGGNHELAQLAARDMALAHRISVAATSYWIAAWDALIRLEAHTLGRLPGHAGAFETSQILALRPDLVRRPLPHRDEAPPPGPPPITRTFRAERGGAWQAIDGFTDSPDRASAALGRAFLDAAATAVATALVEFYRASDVER
ncbi:MAG: creatininase family protein [Armatimonadota bacterium]|nr:creatininase family protein [Armatimonadota bacterium]MDR7422192.1 creatininase family protein [Armatimonadota bacterium]MDR7453095.1 creatininase family protein [Armatimonadota bacterium]MDR7458013.1 creatininase family protein [Armatimonadota bacterium]MDR7495785.1 creatininase family protein [Armatimonadota bacterium]